MTHLLQSKRAVVTGGSRGIGYEVARSLLANGVDVLICGRSEGSLREAETSLRKHAPERKVATYRADVAKSSEVERLFEAVDSELGGLDILVNNAGVGVFRPAGELSIEEWDRVIATNLSGAFYCSHAAIQRFRKAGSGFIINISSLAGRNPFAGGSAYNASKFGLNGFSEATMLDHRGERIRVSYVMPGSVDTAFGGQQAKTDWKIAPEDVAQIVMDILNMPERTLISRVEVRPSRPASH